MTEHSSGQQESASPEIAAAFEPISLIQRIDGFAGARILIIGDIMIDEYLTGDAERISPEAPVPVVVVNAEKRLLGGAGNVARNISSLGGRAHIIGVRGDDVAGAQLERCLAEGRIASSLLTLRNRPTTMKTRVLARQQQVLRFDREVTEPLAREEIGRILGLMEVLLPKNDAVIISDYGKGLVSSELMQGLQVLIVEQQRRIPVLVDPKPKNMPLYQGVTLLTPNAKETSESVSLPVKTPEDIVRAGQEIMRRLGCWHLVTTLGAQGMAVFQESEEVWHIPTLARSVFDVTGAGDTVIAITALGLATRLPLTEACLLANYAAGLVVAEVGSATVTPNQLAEAIVSLPQPRISRWR